MIYIDNASTTFPKPDCVYQAMDSFYRTNGVNSGRGQYAASAVADKIVQGTRDQVKDLLKCNADYETVFTPTATEAINVILQGLDYSGIKTVYITPFEHNSVYRTLYALQKIKEFDIIELYMPKDSLKYDTKGVEKQFTKSPPDLVIMTQASNVCGVITPVEEISLIAKKYDAYVVVDMAQTAGLVDINVTYANIDAAVFAGHKTLYGPMGASGFVMKKNSNIKPLIYGGTGRNSISKDMPDSIPELFEAGTMNMQAITGLNEALTWIKNTGIKTIYKKEQVLKKLLINVISDYRNVRIVGQNDGIGIVSCVFDGYSPDEIGNVLSNFDIAIRSGLHCTPQAHTKLGTLPAGTVRFSLGYFNEASDIRILNEALKYIYDNG